MRYDRVQHVLDSSNIYGSCIITTEKLVRGTEPTFICMRVRNHMNNLLCFRLLFKSSFQKLPVSFTLLREALLGAGIVVESLKLELLKGTKLLLACRMSLFIVFLGFFSFHICNIFSQLYPFSFFVKLVSLIVRVICLKIVVKNELVIVLSNLFATVFFLVEILVLIRGGSSLLIGFLLIILGSSMDSTTLLKKEQ